MAPHTSPASADTDWGTPRTREVAWYSPATLTAAAAELSGRQLLQAISEGRLPPPPMAELVSARRVFVGDARRPRHVLHRRDRCLSAATDKTESRR